MTHKYVSRLRQWIRSVKESNLFSVKITAATILLTIIAVILLVVAIWQRLAAGKSMGIMLIISGVTVLIGIFLSVFLHNRTRFTGFNSFITLRLNILVTRRRFMVAIFILLVEIVLACVIVLATINIKLLGPAYSGILPAFVWIFGISIVLLANLSKVSNGFSTLIHDLRTISLRNHLLFLAWVVGAARLGWFLAKILYPLMHSVIPQYSSSSLTQFLFQGVFAVLFVDLLTLLVGYFPAWLNWSDVTNDVQTEKITPDRRQNLKWFLISLGLTIALFIGYLVCLEPSFDIHDDLLMATMLSGYYGVETIPFPVFSNILLGFLYKPLFSLNPQVNWMVYFSYLLNFLAIWMLLYVVLSTRTKWLYKAFGGLFIFLFSSYFLINVTYTTAAAYGALAGGCLIFSFVAGHVNYKEFRLITGSLLLFLSSLLRFDGMLMVLMVLATVILLNIRRVKFRKLLWSFLPAMLLVGGGYLFHQVYVNTDPGLREYQRLLDLRIEIRDTPRLLHLRDKVLPLYYHGFSTTDAEAFLLSIYIDDEVFSAENLQTLIDITPNTRTDRKEVQEYIVTVVNQSFVLSFVTLAGAVFLGFIMVTRSRWQITSILFTAVIVLLSLAYLFIWHKIPARVINPILFAFSVISWLSLPWFSKNLEYKTHFYIDKFASKLGIVLLLVGLDFSAYSIAAQAMEKSEIAIRNQAMVEEINHKLDQLQDSGLIADEALILPLGGQYYVDRMSPFSLDYPKPKLLMLDWQTSSPVIKSFLNEYNIDIPGRAIFEDPKIYVIGGVGTAALLKEFVRQHYDVVVAVGTQFDLCDPTIDDASNCKYVLFQLVKQ